MRKAFTLVELMVVIGISIMLTGILITYTKSGERQLIFFKEQTLLVFNLLRAKSLAIQTFQPGLQPGGGLTTDKICGWGVHFDKSGSQHKYIIFKDLLQDLNKKCLDPSLVRGYDPLGVNGRSELFEEFTLPSGIEIAKIDLTSASGNQSKADVVFIPPDPLTYFAIVPLKNTVDQLLEIELNLDNGAKISKIKISKSGQITSD